MLDISQFIACCFKEVSSSVTHIEVIAYDHSITLLITVPNDERSATQQAMPSAQQLVTKKLHEKFSAE